MAGLNGILGRTLKPKIIHATTSIELEERIIDWLTNTEENKDRFILGLNYNTTTFMYDEEPVTHYSVMLWYHEVDLTTFRLEDVL